MQFEDVQTFITIIEHGSIAKAAENLYIGQGTASSRIQRLEDELGVKIIFRQPGIRKIKLTPEGETFLSIAKQWISLQQQALNIKEQNIYHELRIASTASNNSSAFLDIYPYFTQMHPDIKLFLQTEHSTEIHQLIENQQIDIGFVNSLHQFPNVKATALWKESMVVLCHYKHPFVKTKNIDLLNIEDEIYLTISSDYSNWHNRVIGNGHPKVSIGDLSLIQSYIIYPDAWAIVPYSCADSLCLKHKSLTIVPFSKDVPPERITYLLTYRYPKPWIDVLTNTFLEEVFKNIENSKSFVKLVNFQEKNAHFFL